MIKVNFLPENIIAEMTHGVSLLETARNNGVDIDSQCESGTCSTCMVRIEKGEDLLYENYGDNYNNDKNLKNILSCIAELKDDVFDGEITIKVL
jgi:ferredoxin